MAEKGLRRADQPESEIVRREACCAAAAPVVPEDGRHVAAMTSGDHAHAAIVSAVRDLAVFE